MQSSSHVNSSSNKTYVLAQEDRARLFQILNKLDNDQLRLIITKHSCRPVLLNDLQQYSRTQLFNECFILFDSCYSAELEQTLLGMRQKHVPVEFYQSHPQANFITPFNQQQLSFYASPTIQYNATPNFRVSSSPAIVQQLRANRLNSSISQSTNGLESRSHQQQQQQQQPSYTPPLLSRPQPIRPAIAKTTDAPNASSASIISHYQVPNLPVSSFNSTMSPSSSRQTPILPATSNSRMSVLNKIAYKSLPFYHIITCVYEHFNAFTYDNYRKQYSSYDEFILQLDVCNQLSLSYDYDPILNIHKTSKCLLLRLARIDQPATFHGQYEDNLPPNLIVQVNGHNITSLPTPKPGTRQQTDLLRVGREIDITPHAMFNPILKNEIKITWSFRPDNASLFLQYANAQYALHIFVAERLTVDDLCNKIFEKPSKFYRQDSARSLAKARSQDHDLGLEVSDQKLKLVCPIDQRRLRKPTRATTCQHLQCFDLTNYIALNEKSNKWLCPVCNKPALFEDLQIDLYTESILNSIKDQNVTEITIDSDLRWTPVIPLAKDDELISSKSNKNSVSSSSDPILIDDD